jgi:putative aminopeptidase FrvX
MRAQTKLIALGAVFMMLLISIIVMALIDDVEGPLIYEVDILSVSPKAGDMIAVIIYCIDSSGVSGAQLSSSVNDEEEELGANGAATIARNLDVDGVLIVDIGLADDFPGTSGEVGVSLEKGPVIVIKDNQIHYSHKQNQELFALAKDLGIPVQRAVYHNYATDGSQIASQGQVVSAIGIPCRYSHSSFETINLEDVEKTIQLIYQFLLSNAK